MISSRFGGSLLLKALQDQLLELPENDNFAKLIMEDLSDPKKKCGAFNRYVKYRYNKSLSIATRNEMLQFLTENYRNDFCLLKSNIWNSPIWNLFGCNETNRDYDVAVMVTNPNKPLYPGEEEKFIRYFRNTRKMAKWVRVFQLTITILMVFRDLFIYNGEYTSLHKIIDIHIMFLYVIKFLFDYNGFDTNNSIYDIIFPKVYDQNRPLDICYLGFHDGSWATMRGGSETINMCYHTYDLHNQMHSPFFTDNDLNDVMPYNKLLILSKFIMDNAEKMIGKQAYKDYDYSIKKKEGYNSGNERFYLSLDMLMKFIVDDQEHYNSYKSTWKSIMLKILQIHFCATDTNYKYEASYYNKRQLADKASDLINPDNDFIEGVLLYKIDNVNKYHREWIVKLYNELFQKYYPSLGSLSFINSSINMKTLSIPNGMLENIYHAFLDSPIEASSEFIETWKSNYNEMDSISNKFIGRSECYYLLDEFPNLTGRILTMDQRSPEWLHVYHNVYQTGLSRGIIQLPNDISFDEKIRRRFNLIVGCIGEMILYDCLIQNIKKIVNDDSPGPCTIGMITDGKPGGRAFCPDALVVMSNKTIIPIEFKTIRCIDPSNDTNFLREYHIANQQLNGVAELLNQDVDELICTECILMTLFIYPNDGSYSFDIYCNTIPFISS
jgi:hypothetical protein